MLSCSKMTLILALIDEVKTTLILNDENNKSGEGQKIALLIKLISQKYLLFLIPT